jgi:hypothetical protein
MRQVAVSPAPEVDPALAFVPVVGATLFDEDVVHVVSVCCDDDVFVPLRAGCVCDPKRTMTLDLSQIKNH